MSYLKFKQNFKFSTEEFRDIFVACIVFGFIVSLGFSMPGEFSRSDWVSYLIDMFFFSIILMFLYVISAKLIAIALGYHAKFQIWYLGLLLGVFAGFISQGRIYLLLPGPVFLKTLPHLRIGKYFPEYTFKDDSWIQFLSFASLLILALIVKYFIFINPELSTLISMCIGFVLFNMIPLPYTAGGKIWFSSKLMYLFSLGYLCVFSAMLLWASFIAALFGGLLGGLIFMILWHLVHWG